MNSLISFQNSTVQTHRKLNRPATKMAPTNTLSSLPSPNDNLSIKYLTCSLHLRGGGSDDSDSDNEVDDERDDSQDDPDSDDERSDSSGAA